MSESYKIKSMDYEVRTKKDYRNIKKKRKIWKSENPILAAVMRKRRVNDYLESLEKAKQKSVSENIDTTES
jgi:hypothetical protein